MRILAVGGGSGGHVTPVVAVLNEIAREKPEALEVEFVCDRSFAPQATKIMVAADMPVRMTIIAAGKLRRYRNFRFVDYITSPDVVVKNIIDLVKIVVGFFQALYILWRRRPDVVFAKGGFVCLPIGWAARLFRIPVVIHDSDARPGLTNRLLAPFAQAIATGYPLDHYPYSLKKSHYVGVPIRDEYQPVTLSVRHQLKKKLHVADDALLIVSFGGGLGARTINQAIIDVAPQLAEQPVQIIAVSGVKQYDEMKAAAEPYKQFVSVLDFVSDGMRDLLAAADIVITRASATSLQELAGLGKAVVAVPARQLGDQHKNAELYAMSDAAIVLTDDQLEQGDLAATLRTMIASVELRNRLAKKIHTFARPDAAREVAKLVMSAAKESEEKQA